jgi:hypothetical protein
MQESDKQEAQDSVGCRLYSGERQWLDIYRRQRIFDRYAVGFHIQTISLQILDCYAVGGFRETNGVAVEYFAKSPKDIRPLYPVRLHKQTICYEY